MSPASRSKSKDKKAGKEAQKASSKPTGSANGVNGLPSSAYNPLSGTFHTLETIPVFTASPLHGNGRFRNIDEADEHHGGTLGNGIEYDSVSNNGSWSGESEDHKDKTSNTPVKQEIVPGADNDKREKIRQKNERKHQRQKERRAQELHERCTGYLMSRKLEALAQQLVAMGFPQERSTMALILNEGRVEESVAWLLSEETDHRRDHTVAGSNLKLDISEELAQIAGMEMRYKCSKQEVERVVVTCEGDLEKAADMLKTLKHDPPSALPKSEENGNPPNASSDKLSVVNQNTVRIQAKPIVSSTTPQLRRDDKDFNYTRPPPVPSAGPLESGNKNVQPLKRIQPKIEWSKPQQTAVPTEKRWPGAGSSPSVSYSMASPLQVSPPPAKSEIRYVNVGSELKNLKPESLREPVVVMQRPQSVNTKQYPVTSISASPPRTTPSWHPTSSAEILKANRFLNNFTSIRSPNPDNMSSNQTYQQQHFMSGSSSGTSRGNNSWIKIGSSPTLAAASSLGLFSGWGSSGSSGASSAVDWNTGGSVHHLDYKNIDWSLDRGLSSSSSQSPRPSGLWLGLASFMNDTHLYDDSSSSGMGGMRPPTPNRNGVSIVAGLQEGSAETPSSAEWSSPFEGKDLFSLPRRFVSSPSL